MKIRFIAISALFHAAIAIFLLRSEMTTKKFEFVSLENNTSTGAFLEQQVLKSTSKTKSNNKDKGGGYRKDSFVKKNPLSAIIRNPVYNIQSEGIISSQEATLNDGSLGGENYFKDVVELPRPMETIWRQIRAHIHYHSDFYEDHIQGDVKAEILIGKLGRLESLVSIDGHSMLVEWVKTALSEALSKDFLRSKLEKKLLITLKFRFRILPYPAPVENFVFNHLELNFNILGYRDFEVDTANSIYKKLAGSKSKKSNDWNFTKQLEPYQHACYKAKNQTACKHLIQKYQQAGLHLDANNIKKLLPPN